MLVCIITIALNAEDFIQKTLDSVVEQDYKHIEHIIIDGKSTDSTLKIINQNMEKYAQKGYKLIIKSEKDHGIYDAMNKGLKLSSGKIVGFLNANDTLAHKNIISIIAHAFHKNIQCVFGNVEFIKNDTQQITRIFKSPDFNAHNLFERSRNKNHKSLFEKGYHPAHPTFYALKSVYDRDFDTSYKIASDFEMMLYLLQIKKIKSLYIDETFVKMADGGISNNGVMNVLKANIECYRACKKHKLNVNRLFIIKKPLKNIKQMKSIAFLLQKIFNK